MIDAQLVDWMTRFQKEKDVEALVKLKAYCYDLIEPLITEFTKKYGQDAGVLLHENWDKRFYFIFTKYEMNVGLPLDSFVTNAYRFYFIQLLKEAGY